MSYWSIGQWRASIGSSWCALGRPIKTRTPYRGGGGCSHTMLTRTRAVSMIIMLMVFVGIHLQLCSLVRSGYSLSFESFVVFGLSVGLLQILYLINCCMMLMLVLPSVKIVAMFLYQYLHHPVKSLVMEVCSSLFCYFLLDGRLLTQWIIFPIISPLVVDVFTTLNLMCRDLFQQLPFGAHLTRCLTLFVLHVIEYSLSALSIQLKKVFIFSMKHALDETVLSVAESVIYFHLMLSGDVESNPGPDTDYDSVDAEQILNEDDLSDIMEECESIKLNFFPLGRCLRLANDDLKAICQTYPDESASDKALNDVLLLWLNRKYKIDRFGPPTWRMLVEAVDKKTGGNNHKLAKEIAQKHLAALTPNNVKEMLDVAWDSRARWRFIGIELSFDTGTLDAIEYDKRKAEDCLSELISEWLRQSDPRPTRRAMAKALESPSVAVSQATSVCEAADSKSDERTVESYSLYMRSLYKAKGQKPFSSPDQWPPTVTMKVFRLAMIEAEQLRIESTQDEFLRHKTITAKVDKVVEHNCKTIELTEIFRGTVGKPKIVIIEGPPGCGKSTLSLHICLLWSEDKLFQEYKLVILVRLRDPAVQCAKSIMDLLPYQSETVAQDVEKSIRVSDGDGVLFVLDGWDELPKTAPGHSVVLSLIDRTQLHKCSIVISSRPTSSAILHPLVSSRIQIIGFTRNELRRFFTECLQDDIAKVDTLLRIITENPAVEGCCYLPVNASVVVHLFKCEENLHFASQYSIFSALVRNCIIRHLRKNRLDDKIPALTSLENLPELVDGPFKDLCELAFDGIVQDKVTFDVKLSSSFSTLGLLQGVESFAGCGVSHSYNFIHLSIQEMLAAFHIATQFKAKKQVSVFKDLFGQARFHSVFGFFAAKTRLQTPGISDVIMKIVGKCTVEDCTREDKVQLLSLLRCLFEAQDPTLCQLVVDQRVKHVLSFNNFIRYIRGNLPEHISELNFSNTSLNPMDCLSIGYFLASIRTTFDVRLYECSIGPEGCKGLFRGNGQVYHIRNLSLSSNSIGDEGVVAISEGLKTMVDLQFLRLENNSIGDEGAVAISEAMKTMTNLKLLDLEKNSIGDEGAVAISEAMKTMTNLQWLDLDKNSIGDEGAVAISEAMKTMTNLQTLYIWHNSISEVGKQALHAAKQKGTRLSV